MDRDIARRAGKSPLRIAKMPIANVANMRSGLTNNLTRILRFDGDTRSLYRGYASRWSEYCLGEIALNAISAVIVVEPSNQLDHEIIESSAQTVRQKPWRTANETWGQAGIVVRQKSKQRERIGLRARSFGCIENV